MRDMIKSTLTLLVISFCVVLVVSFVNMITIDIIAERELKNTLGSMPEALYTATRFNQVPDEINELVEEDKIVQAVYVGYDDDDNFKGLVFDNITNGYGGEMQVIVGITESGEVLDVILGQNSETPGLGSLVGEKTFKSQFVGKDVFEITLNIVTSTPESKSQVQAVTGATESSQAMKEAVNASSTLAQKIIAQGGF